MRAAALGASSGSCAKRAVSDPAVRASASVAAQGDVVFERGTELGFLFVRSGILALRRLLEDLYSFL
jgi:hypothetical protein